MNELYDSLDISHPEVVLTDCELGLTQALRHIFPGTAHLLCIWHIDKNVLTHCRSEFDSKENWNVFYTAWHRVMYAETVKEYEDQWSELNSIYRISHWQSMNYINDKLIRFYKKKFVKCWTDRFRHFNNHATSRSEGSHARLKSVLLSSTGDLKTVVDQLDLLLIN